jgi:hypothetical protein
MKKYLLIFITAFLFFSFNTKEKEATKTVFGIAINDKTREELIGVKIKCGDKVYYSDLFGEFKFDACSSDSILTVSYPSYETKTYNIENKNSVLVELKSK